MCRRLNLLVRIASIIRIGLSNLKSESSAISTFCPINTLGSRKIISTWVVALNISRSRRWLTEARPRRSRAIWVRICHRWRIRRRRRFVGLIQLWVTIRWPAAIAPSMMSVLPCCVTKKRANAKVASTRIHVSLTLTAMQHSFAWKMLSTHMFLPVRLSKHHMQRVKSPVSAYIHFIAGTQMSRSPQLM